MGTAYQRGPKQAALHVGHLHTGSGDLCRVSQGAGKTEGKRGRLRPETLNTGEKANAVSRGPPCGRRVPFVLMKTGGQTSITTC